MILADLLMAQGFDRIAKVPRFEISNVADYYYHHEKEFWCLKEFPYPRPPFDELWIEYKAPHTVYSNERGEIKIHVPGAITFVGALVVRIGTTMRWRVIASMQSVIAHGGDKGKIFRTTDIPTFEFKIEEDGTCSSVFIKEDDARTTEQVATDLYVIHPMLMAFSFANCRNIEIVEVVHPEKLQKARVRRHKPPVNSYHVINILPFGKIFHKSSRTIVTADLKLDLVIRRGSYGRYGPAFNRGLLFGKYEGLFWRHATVASDKVDRTYEVKHGKLPIKADA